jgi:hypothetical protein
MTETSNPLVLQATAELDGAMAAITVNSDEQAGRMVGDVRKLVDHVNSQSNRAAGTAARLHADDVMAPAGKARLLAEIPADLTRATAEQLDQADLTLDLLEVRFLGQVLHHDSSQDTALHAEIANYVAAIDKQNAAVRLVQLASDPRYSTLIAGPLGTSLCARFGLKDPAVLRKAALQTLATEGNAKQVAASAALTGFARARRVVGLTRGARDHAASESQRAPKREQTANALMS